MEQWREREQKSQETLCYGCCSRCWSHGNRTDVCGAWISSMSRRWVPTTDRRGWGDENARFEQMLPFFFLLACRLASAYFHGQRWDVGSWLQEQSWIQTNLNWQQRKSREMPCRDESKSAEEKQKIQQEHVKFSLQSRTGCSATPPQKKERGLAGGVKCKRSSEGQQSIKTQNK